MSIKKISLLIILSLFTACGNTSKPLFSVKSDGSSNTTLLQKTEQKDILEAINRARSVARDCHDGLGLVGPSQALRWSDELYDSAYEHSMDLAQSNTFSHSGSGTEYDITGMNRGGRKSQFFERIESNGYSDFYTLGENIAGGQSALNQVMNDWLESPAHCTNIMNDKFKEVGVAIVTKEDSNFKIYWTQNFGAKL